MLDTASMITSYRAIWRRSTVGRNL